MKTASFFISLIAMPIIFSGCSQEIATSNTSQDTNQNCSLIAKELNKHKSKNKELIKQLNKAKALNSEASNEIKKNNIPKKKMEIYSLISFEYPGTWSGLKLPERMEENKLSGLPTISIAPKNIAYGDMNWSQIDFYFSINDISEKLLKEYNQSEFQVSSELIDGIQASVVNFPLDESKTASKSRTGGKKYFISLPGNIKTLVIWKQARTTDEFESEFENIINSIKFHH